MMNGFKDVKVKKFRLLYLTKLFYKAKVIQKALN